MAKIDCLCVGKELLIGKTVNTNGNWIGSRLFRIGTMLDRILVVTDSLVEIRTGLEELLARKPDFIIIVGGLGPTPDDMTLKGVAQALGRKIRLNREALSLMRAHYAAIGRDFEMTPARRKMAQLPEGSAPLPNGVGTAPGVRMVQSGTVVFCLPGVPKEMMNIFATSIQPEIKEKVGTLYTTKNVMHLTGIYESALAPKIAQAMKRHPYAYIKSHPKGIKEGKSSVELDIVCISTRRTDSESECEAISRFFAEEIGNEGGSILKNTLSTVGS
jgi:nicotinamide-nucleotide amidase